MGLKAGNPNTHKTTPAMEQQVKEEEEEEVDMREEKKYFTLVQSRPESYDEVCDEVFLKNLKRLENTAVSIIVGEHFYPLPIFVFSKSLVDLLFAYDQGVLEGTNLVFSGESLRILSLNYCILKDLSLFVFPSSLRELNRINDVSGLALPPFLEKLELHSNRIWDVSRLVLPSALVYLCLHDNDIFDVSSLKLPNGLRELRLDRNKIRYLTHLKHPFNLRKLWLEGNPLQDLSTIYSWAYTSRLESMWFSHRDESLNELLKRKPLFLFIDSHVVQKKTKMRLPLDICKQLKHMLW